MVKIRGKKKNKQLKLFETRLDEIIDLDHPLGILANQIDWQALEDQFLPTYSSFKGRPAKAVRLMVGLQFLKYTYNHSDQSVVYTWLENPYWQYFVRRSNQYCVSGLWSEYEKIKSTLFQCRLNSFEIRKKI